MRFFKKITPFRKSQASRDGTGSGEDSRPLEKPIETIVGSDLADLENPLMELRFAGQKHLQFANDIFLRHEYSPLDSMAIEDAVESYSMTLELMDDLAEHTKLIISRRMDLLRLMRLSSFHAQDCQSPSCSRRSSKVTKTRLRDSEVSKDTIASTQFLRAVVDINGRSIDYTIGHCDNEAFLLISFPDQDANFEEEWDSYVRRWSTVCKLGLPHLVTRSLPLDPSKESDFIALSFPDESDPLPNYRSAAEQMASASTLEEHQSRFLISELKSNLSSTKGKWKMKSHTTPDDKLQPLPQGIDGGSLQLLGEVPRDILDGFKDFTTYLSEDVQDIYNHLSDRRLVILGFLCHWDLEKIFTAHESFLQLISNDSDLLERTKQLEGPAAVCMLDLIQEFLDKPESRSVSALHADAFSLLKQISNRVQHLPESILLRDEIEEVSEYPIATGGFAEVYRGFRRGKPVALKVLRVLQEDVTEKALQKLFREALLWRQLNHPYLLPFEGVCMHVRHSLVAPWMPYGSLANYLQNNPTNADHAKFAMQIARGLSYLHNVPRIVHGDMRADNVLIDENEDARVSDFGLATLFQDAHTMGIDVGLISAPQASGGAVRWSAPEYILPGEGRVQYKHMPGDVYAWACVMQEIFMHEVPFSQLRNDGQVLLALQQGKLPLRDLASGEREESISRGLTDEVNLLMQHCWNTRPEDRPQMKDVCKTLGKLFHMKWDDMTYSELGFEVSPRYHLVPHERGVVGMSSMVI